MEPKRKPSIVVGATFPDEMSLVRKEIGYEIPILVPGVGAQGGDLGKVLEMGTDEKGGNILINVSRGIMFAFDKMGVPDSEMGMCASEEAGSYKGRIREELERCGRW